MWFEMFRWYLIKIPIKNKLDRWGGQFNSAEVASICESLTLPPKLLNHKCQISKNGSIEPEMDAVWTVVCINQWNPMNKVTEAGPKFGFSGETTAC